MDYQIHTSYQDEAYKFIQEAYSTISISKEELWRQVEAAAIIYHITDKAKEAKGNNMVIAVERYEGYRELVSILKECQLLLDGTDIAEFRRGQNIFRLEIVNSKYHIIIQKNFVERTEVFKVIRR